MINESLVSVGETEGLYEPLVAAVVAMSDNRRLRNAVAILRASDLNEIDKCAAAVNILADSFQVPNESDVESKIESGNAGSRLLSAEVGLMRILTRLVRQRSGTN